MSKILFLPRENKIYNFKRRVMFFLLYRQNDIDKIIEGNYQNYAIDKLTCEIMENKPLGSSIAAVCCAAKNHRCESSRVTSPFSGEGNQNGEKTTIGLISKRAALHVQHTFLYISLPLFCTTTTLNF